MATFLHTMVRITDPERSRGFYEALGFRFSHDMDIVRNGEREATNYFFSLGDAENVLELTYTTTVARTSWARRTGTSQSPSTTSTRRSRHSRTLTASSPSARRTRSPMAARASALSETLIDGHKH